MKIRAGFICCLLFTVAVSLFSSGQREENFSYIGIDKIVLKNGALFDVSIIGRTHGDSNSLEGAIVSPGKSNMIISHYRRGSTLVLNAETEFLLFPDHNGEHRLDLQVPSMIELDISVDSGNISIDNCNGLKSISSDSGRVMLTGSDGVIQVETQSGEIFLKDIVGTVYGKSDSGMIEMQFVEGDAFLSSGSGALLVHQIQGLFNLDSVSGDISVRKFSLLGNSRITSQSGAVLLAFDSPLRDYRLIVETQSGSVFQNGQMESFSGVVGDGYPDIEIITGSGSIFLED